MAKIVLISCVGKKKSHKTKAKDLYQSAWFKHAWNYASSLNPDKTFILSAEYGLLDTEKEIHPYEKTLNRMKIADVKKWAESVLASLVKVADLNLDDFVFLAGSRYRRFIVPKIKNYNVPMEGLGIGKQLQYLKNNA